MKINFVIYLLGIISYVFSNEDPWYFPQIKNYKEAYINSIKNNSFHNFIFMYTPFYSKNKSFIQMIDTVIHAFHKENDFTFHKKLNYKTNDNKLIFYEKVKKARKCLTQDPYQLLNINELILKESTDKYEMVHFINEMTGKYRLLNGKLSKKGIKIKNMEKNCYHIKNNNKICQICDTIDIFYIHIHPKRFYNGYIIKNKPVIIKNGIKHWNAFKRWSNEYLLNKIGNRKVHIKVAPNGIFEGCENRKLWEENKNKINIPYSVYKLFVDPNKILVRPATMDILFKDFLNLLYSINYHQNNITDNEKPSYYLEYLSISSYFPDLQFDAPSFEWADLLQLKIKNLWFGDGNTIGKIHFDPYDNLLGMVAGEKIFTIIDPTYSNHLKEGHIQEGLLEYNNITKRFSRNILMESTSMVNSPIELKDINPINSTDFHSIPQTRCHVKKGDVLFLPAFWWHEVESKPEKLENHNIAVNFWYEPFWKKEFPCPLCKLEINNAYEKIYLETNPKIG